METLQHCTLNKNLTRTLSTIESIQ